MILEQEVRKQAATELESTRVDGEKYYVIRDVNKQPPFFMSVVSSSDHWMFISSTGGLSAGRKNSNYALFPYYTDDKLQESSENTGSKTILKVQSGDDFVLWEPFSIRNQGAYAVKRNLYKSIVGDKIIFEEINQELNLTFRYQWSFSDKYGFVRKASLENGSDAVKSVELVDGIQNIMPANVGSDLQNRASNLVNAYKRSELHRPTGLGIYALSATIVDKAEPSESLKANVVWSLGLEDATVLLSSNQLETFRNEQSIVEETDSKGARGAYFVHKKITLSAKENSDWVIVAEVDLNHTAINSLIHSLDKKSGLYEKVMEDVADGTRQLIALNASADGIQCTADPLRDGRHFSNVLFNNMRGGIFDDNYKIQKEDFETYLKKANASVYKKHQGQIQKLSEHFTLFELREWLESEQDVDILRLATEYLPLCFSRRHGDPSRPWNKFSIKMRGDSGKKILDYEGNWRDIFQNWEALAHAFPEFIDGMIFKFLNASTFDGYNPYRVTKDGFDWETIEPDDPWSYIGYWGDHQVIYLLKFLEFSEKYFPGRLQEFVNQSVFVYAHVPYRIKSYADIVKNPKDTIDFDGPADERIRDKRDSLGADGALLEGAKGSIHHVTFMEKILAVLLSKMSNFVPEGGIWMNTQRPEWNDANNALVGNGISMVTLYYLHRFLVFMEDLLGETSEETVAVSEELVTLFEQMAKVLETNEGILNGKVDDQTRKSFVDALGQAASDFRNKVYDTGFSGEKASIAVSSLKKFVLLSRRYLVHSIRANKRSDNLYHAYNLLTFEKEGLRVEYLNEMLEGQVAVLSARFAEPDETLAILDALKNSALFRPDQYSYMLYPNKQLPGFLEKNNLPKAKVEKSILLQRLVQDGNTSIIEKDVNGTYHFNGNFRNADDLVEALESLDEDYQDLVATESALVHQIFEDVFNHKAFIGRSGTFFAYEGLGSIYWHMVSKLLLAVQECCLDAYQKEVSDETMGRLLEHYYEIQAGIGVHKSPDLYGAFPTDPYSHTPMGRGAQQPGMTGQVKEDIISRFGELGIAVDRGQVHFDPYLLRKNEEFLTEPRPCVYFDIAGQQHEIMMEKDTLFFTYCQVPIVYKLAASDGMEIHHSDGTVNELTGRKLDTDVCQALFKRTGAIDRIIVSLSASSFHR